MAYQHPTTTAACAVLSAWGAQIPGPSLSDIAAVITSLSNAAARANASQEHVEELSDKLEEALMAVETMQVEANEAAARALAALRGGVPA